MKKKQRYFPVGVALNVETLEMVDLLAETQERNRSQAIRWLIRQAMETPTTNKATNGDEATTLEGDGVQREAGS